MTYQEIRAELLALSKQENPSGARAAELVGKLQRMGISPRRVGLNLRRLGLSPRQLSR